jgi:hypothetical protein
MLRLFRLTILFACAASVSACLPAKQFYWGSYEDSLYSRQQHAGANGETEAATMLLATINEAQTEWEGGARYPCRLRVSPVQARQNRRGDRGAAERICVVPRIKTVMETMVSRIQGRMDKVKKDKKRTP